MEAGLPDHCGVGAGGQAPPRPACCLPPLQQTPELQAVKQWQLPGLARGQGIPVSWLISCVKQGQGLSPPSQLTARRAWPPADHSVLSCRGLCNGEGAANCVCVLRAYWVQGLVKGLGRRWRSRGPGEGVLLGDGAGGMVRRGLGLLSWGIPGKPPPLTLRGGLA